MRLLGDAMRSFDQHCLQGLTANVARMEELLQHSLMLVTALSPHIGYDRAGRIAKHAHAQGGSLRDAAWDLEAISAEQFDAWVNPARMAGQPARLPDDR
jgi:fumarate hydratase class II